MKEVAVDLAGTVGGVTGDGIWDVVQRFGSIGNDKIAVASVNGNVTVTGLSAKMTVSHAEAADSSAIAAIVDHASCGTCVGRRLWA